MFALVLLFVLVPLLEVYLFIEVGGAIGAVWTIGLIVLTAVVGAALVRAQGLSLLLTARAKMQDDQLPADEIFSGFCVAAAGVLLVTPGFFTDAVGFLLLWPGFRAFLRDMILDGFLGAYTYGLVDVDTLRDGRGKAADWRARRAGRQRGGRGADAGHGVNTSPHGNDVVDADYEVVDEDEQNRR